MEGDTPIALANVINMSTENHDILLQGIRERRLQPVKEYEEFTLLQSEARREGLEKKFLKQQEMFKRELERADKAMEKIEIRSRTLKLIKMELEAI